MIYSKISIKYLFLIFVIFPFILIGQINPTTQEIIEIDEEKFEKISNSTVTIVVDCGVGSGFIFEEGKVLTNLQMES